METPSNRLEAAVMKLASGKGWMEPTPEEKVDFLLNRIRNMTSKRESSEKPDDEELVLVMLVADDPRGLVICKYNKTGDEWMIKGCPHNTGVISEAVKWWIKIQPLIEYYP